MFKFNFAVDDVDNEVLDLPVPSGPHATDHPGRRSDSRATTREHYPAQIAQWTEHTLDDLLSALPPAISFSPLHIPLSFQRSLVLARRDLFDARFQLISLEDIDVEDPSNDAGRRANTGSLEFLDAPLDLVPGVYEGGLKTWECALDLVDCLDGLLGAELPQNLRGKKVLELGCGTAIPSLYILHRLFSTEPTLECAEADHTADAGSDEIREGKAVLVHLQDYNELVLRLVTLPNIILTWYMSSASHSFRSSPAFTSPQEDDELLPPADPTQPGALPLTPALLAAFRASLRAYRIRLQFSSGAWETFPASVYDIVLTSETIYRPESLHALVRVLRGACRRSDTLEDATAKLFLTGGEEQKWEDAPYLCLVAAKRVYFGVGGGVTEFVRTVEEPEKGARGKGRVETVWEHTKGVQRIVMRITWDQV